MDDLISRQAVIEQTYNWINDDFLRVTNPFDYLRKRINSLQPVNPQPKTSNSENQNKWHKEPPKKDGRYLVWCDRVEIANYADNLYKVDKYDFYDFKGKKRAGWYIYDGEYGYLELDNVLGWQELPSDYKENEDEE